MFIHHKDALRTEIGDIWKTELNRPESIDWYNSNLPSMHVIGNLPFNIASPLIIKYLRDMSYRRGVWQYGRVPLTLTFQLEVAKRICSPIACDTRSRISIMAQYISEPQMVFQISGSCFVPRPQVDVGVVRFVPRKVPLVNTSFEVLEKVCRQVFHYRQKYMEKGLKTLYPPELEDELADELLKKCRIDPTTTSIRLGIEQFADLAEGYNQQCLRHPGLFLYDYTNKHHTLEKLAKEQNALPPPSPVFHPPSRGSEGDEWSLKNFIIQ
uniref:rRNA adenine N(6)-methyltransferase n=1 Tax=Caenorhabditis tropicalis TaxID=1561998 RepID=A0A1I7TKD8_9PELO